MTLCPVCGSETKDPFEKCGNCGAPPTGGDPAMKRCPSCDAVLRDEDVQCRWCGYELASSGATDAPAPDVPLGLEVSFEPTLGKAPAAEPTLRRPPLGLEGSFEPPFGPGVILAGRWEVGEFLGAGSMGEVYAARDRKLDREVALKILPRELTRDARWQVHYQREARHALELSHLNVTRVYDLQEDQSRKATFLVMERLHGFPLDAVLAERGALPWEEARRVVLEAGRGLAHVHEKGLLHGDLKPANLFLSGLSAPGETLTAKGVTLKVMDFGLSVDLLNSQSQLRAASPSGTLLYLAPERLVPGSQVDGRADFYSLGVMLYEMLEGHPPFQGPPELVIHHHKHDAPPRPDPGRCPEEAWVLLESLLAKDPEKRPVSVERFFSEGAKTDAPIGLKAESDSVVNAETVLSGRCSLVLVSAGDRKIEVIKWIREFTGMGLKESKDLAEQGGRASLGEISEDRAATIRKKFEDLGARVSIERVETETGKVHNESPCNEEQSLTIPLADVGADQAAFLPNAGSPALRAGETMVNPKDGLTYVWIPPGSFEMGASPGDDEASDDEKPRHRVRITQGFWLSRTPVTVGAYKKFCAATRRAMPIAPKFNEQRGFLKKAVPWPHDDHPIVNVSWDDAVAYSAWAGGRLPTEAEWQYAARAGTGTVYYWGNSKDGAYAWYRGNSGWKTHPVGEKKANGWGLYDMAGNVWEWCSDWYDENYYKSSPSHDPQGPTSGQSRVLRGGSWRNGPIALRASYRAWSAPGARVGNGGFRVVLPTR